VAHASGSEGDGVGERGHGQEAAGDHDESRVIAGPIVLGHLSELGVLVDGGRRDQQIYQLAERVLEVHLSNIQNTIHVL
jgi:hypothetical protein